MSWGVASIVIVVSAFCIAMKRYWAFLLACIVAALIGISVFVSYFEIRNDLREAAWQGAPIAERAEQAFRIVEGLSIVDSTNELGVRSLDKRLNQNYFIGVASERLERGQIDYLWGRSVWEGVIALIPRAIWPDKPVFGGSGSIVRDMTGLELESRSTAWGVGSIMEFYVNFGRSGMALCLVAFGFLLGWLDSMAARRLAERDFGNAMIYGLPALALIQPLGSLVELSGGAAAGLLAALAWRWAWNRGRFSRWTSASRPRAVRLADSFAPSVPPTGSQPEA